MSFVMSGAWSGSLAGHMYHADSSSLTAVEFVSESVELIELHLCVVICVRLRSGQGRMHRRSH